MIRSLQHLALLLLGLAGATTGIVVPPGQPAISPGLVLPEGAAVLAVSPDGAWVAVASVSGAGKDARTRLDLHAGPEAPLRTVELEGSVRALLFGPDGASLLAVQGVARRHIELADLFRVDLATLETRRLIRVPPTTRALAYWPPRQSLLLACRDEIRTLELPGLRAGRLYRVPGENLALVWTGESQVLIGQDDALLWVDLADPPGHDEHPVRQRVATPAPVHTLGLAADGSSGLAELADGRIFELDLYPLTLRDPAASGVLPGGFLPAIPVTHRVAVVEEPVAASPPPVVPEPVVSRSPDPAPAPPAPAAPPEEELPVRPEPAPPRTGDAVWIDGRLSGPHAAEVLVIGINGPDNILAPAARVEPAPDGSWHVEGLTPGRYRIQPLGRPGRVLLVEPPFVMLEIGAGGPVPTVEFRVLGIR